ncbi:hypothetical protein [Halobellus salinus]|uniref:hypothetical protein n=1 Tax=Halobellus salinus TaxID=931585 RepID=UPI0031F312AE
MQGVDIGLDLTGFKRIQSEFAECFADEQGGPRAEHVSEGALLAVGFGDTELVASLLKLLAKIRIDGVVSVAADHGRVFRNNAGKHAGDVIKIVTERGLMITTDVKENHDLWIEEFVRQTGRVLADALVLDDCSVDWMILRELRCVLVESCGTVPFNACSIAVVVGDWLVTRNLRVGFEPSVNECLVEPPNNR